MINAGAGTQKWNECCKKRIVRQEVRKYTGADGVSFILRENDTCFYADEEAIEPLWKGQRFPLSQCISGWVMEHKEAAGIKDIYADDRIPHDDSIFTRIQSLWSGKKLRCI